MSPRNNSAIATERIQSRIRVLREHKVLLDSDLADLYEVKVKDLNAAVRRNLERFPDDFMFQISADELQNLRLNLSTSSSGRHGGRRYLPNAFTEQGVAMLSSVLRSPRAIHVNIEIMRSFVELRRYAITHDELRKRIDALEQKTDRGLRKVLDTIRKLMEPEAPPRPTLGFARKKLG